MRVEWEGGHGQGATRTQRVEELADIYAFLLWQFRHEGFVPEAPAPATAATGVPATAPASEPAAPAPVKPEAR
jgi:hypothetical protein